MTINDFLNKYYLHDSLVKNVSSQNNKVELTIDFCFWMQENYQEKDPETGIIHMVLPNASIISGPTGDLDDYSILEVEYHDNCIFLLIMDDFHNLSYEIKIHSSSNQIELVV